jgi:hypothetical protein
VGNPSIFISATSADLHSARDLVAKLLVATGYTPVWQDIAALDGGDLVQVLKQRIAPCEAVIQLIGSRFGFAPASPGPEIGDASYTQFEAIHAERVGKKVIYILLPENYPTDPCDPEPAEKAKKQKEYRERVRASGKLYHPAGNATELENRILKFPLVHWYARRTLTKSPSWPLLWQKPPSEGRMASYDRSPHIEKSSPRPMTRNEGSILVCASVRV